ncbi:MAG: biotin--[acetyl-CoA-carboxylase] ligase [Ruminococcaceae bacterium]|nr:biotin--[acetyl-CoA-carboxylase] ligase [Oscillospiraceae bacterium]
MENAIRHIHFDSIDSTNAEARRLIADGKISTPVLITADTQTAGRGRMGRSFYSPDGTGLYMSFVFPAPDLVRISGLITPAAAVAAHQAILHLTGITTQIKWVNDLYFEGKKICGILCESVQASGACYVIVGIGINLTTRGFPDGLRAPAGSLLSEDRTPPPDLTNTLALDISRRLTEDIRSDFARATEHLAIYREHSFLDGKRVNCTVGERTFDGTALGIGDDFSLSVLTDSGEAVNISSGEASVKLTERQGHRFC